MAKRREAATPARQLELASAVVGLEQRVPTPAPPAIRPPVILQLGPRDFSVLAWVRDEGDAPVYRVVKDRIKAASTAAVLVRKLQEGKR
jgi:hypothetical protein